MTRRTTRADEEKKEMVKNLRLDEDGILINIWFDEKTKQSFSCIVIPDLMKDSMLRDMHDSVAGGGHLGVKSTWNRLRTKFIWRSAYADVKAHVRACSACNARNHGKRASPGELEPLEAPTKPFQSIKIDIQALSKQPNERGFSKALVITDRFFKWVCATPIKDEKAETIAQYLIEEIIFKYDSPDELISDRAKNFLGNIVQAVCDYGEITKTNTSGWNPQCNRNVERMNGTLAAMLSKYVSRDQSNWDELIPFMTYAYNTLIHPVTECTPWSLVHKYDPRLPTIAGLEKPRRFVKPGEGVREVREYRQGLIQKTTLANEMVHRFLEGERERMRATSEGNSRPDAKLKVGDMVRHRAGNCCFRRSDGKN